MSTPCHKLEPMLMELTATATAISDAVATKVEVELIADPAAELAASVKVAAEPSILAT